MRPPLTDLVALLGIALVLCAGLLRLLGQQRSRTPAAAWLVAACFGALWLPAGSAQLPLLAYVRGVSSDLSITLVALACAFLAERLLGCKAPAQREKTALHGAVVLAALLLYPLALGWGDWDAYRAGWGAPGMLAALLALALLCWAKGLRWLPLLIGLALIAWSLGLMESTNLWDYLLDPWLATAAVFHSLRWGAGKVRSRWRPGPAEAG